MEIEYGYYPQTAVSKNMQEELENSFQKGNILSTGNIYTTDSRKNDDWENGFEKQEYKEYEYDGKRYVRMIANSCFDGEEFTLSNGEKYKNGDIVWLEIEPIKWLVDEKTGIIITEKIIGAGIQFNQRINYTRNFKKTEMYKFLNTFFIKDITQNIYKELEVKVEYEKTNREVELENIEKAKQKILALKNKIK